MRQSTSSPPPRATSHRLSREKPRDQTPLFSSCRRGSHSMAVRTAGGRSPASRRHTRTCPAISPMAIQCPSGLMAATLTGAGKRPSRRDGCSNAAMSHRRADPSRLPVTNQRPSEPRARAETASLWPLRVIAGGRIGGAPHRESRPAVTKDRPSGLNRARMMGPRWPLKSIGAMSSSASVQSRRPPSSAAVSNWPLSELNSNSVIQAWGPCAWISRGGDAGRSTSQMMTVPKAPPVAMCLPWGSTASAETLDWFGRSPMEEFSIGPVLSAERHSFRAWFQSALASQAPWGATATAETSRP
jgi:hypothetical protein